MPKKPKKRDKHSREERVARHWVRRVPNSDWARMDTGGEGFKNEYFLREEVTTIQTRIASGQPLTFSQYHLAIALHYLITELPYEEFFTKRWHETKDHRSYGPGGPKHCYDCKLAAREQRKARSC